MEADVALPAELRSAADARRFAERVLRSWSCDALVESARLLISELVVNAVRHGDSSVTVRLALDSDRLRVEVGDTGASLPEIQNPEPTAVGGRGLMIVDAVASAWGVDELPEGKVVWFELDTGHPGSAGA